VIARRICYNTGKHSRYQEQHGGKYAESLDGLLIRLNNRKQYVFAYVPASTDERRFDPTRDVYIKPPEEDTFHR
jgi:hypothetical protein